MTDFFILRYFISHPFITDSVNVVYEKYYPPLATSRRGKDGAHTSIKFVPQSVAATKMNPGVCVDWPGFNPAN